ncbi:MAG: Forkhead-associated protein, partial [Microbacterium sp.]
MNSTIDASLAPLVGALAFVIAIALYVWMSLALSAMFRKMGEESWKGWVPFLNHATVLAWGGFNPWLVLLVLVPGIGALVVLVLLVISAHRINPGFGYGPGMTVLAALLFVVWASILGFGPTPWRGARHSTAPPVPPRPPLPATSAAFAASSAPVPPQAGPGLPAPAFPPLPP